MKRRKDRAVVQAARSFRLNRRWRIISAGVMPRRKRLRQTGRSGSGPGCPSPCLNKEDGGIISYGREVGTRRNQIKKARQQYTGTPVIRVLTAIALSQAMVAFQQPVSLLTHARSFRSAGASYLPMETTVEAFRLTPGGASELPHTYSVGNAGICTPFHLRPALAAAFADRTTDRACSLVLLKLGIY